MNKPQAATANIVVADEAATIFNLMKGALGCRSDELFEEILEFYLSRHFQSRLEAKAKDFLSMIKKIKDARDEATPLEEVWGTDQHASTEGKVEIPVKNKV